MSTISIKVDMVRSLNCNLGSNAVKLSNLKMGISTLKYNVDYKIRVRRNIGSRINAAYNSAAALESNIRKLQIFIDNSINNYCAADDYLLREALSLNSLIDKYTQGDWKKSLICDTISRDTSLLNNASNITDDNYKEGNDKFVLGRDALMGFSAKALDSDNIFKIMKGLNFYTVEKDGKVFIKVINGNIANNMDYQKYRNLFSEELGGTSKWNKKFLTQLSNDGIPLYDTQADRFFNSNRNKFLNTGFDDLNKYVGNIGDSKLTRMGKSWKDTGVSGIKFWDDFKPSQWKGVTTATKVSKGLGVAGTVITIGTNAKENFYNPKTGKVEFSGLKLKDFAVDVGVDIGTGAGAMAAGAAIGSLIVPPVGTVIGAGLGVLINLGINWKFYEPPKSIVDHTKTFFKDPIKTLDKIFW